MSTPSHYENAVYSEVAAASGKEFTISENKCYGDVGYTKTNAESKAMRKAVLLLCSSISVPLLAIVIVSLLATVDACIALGLEIAQLKSDTATHQESQNALVSRIESTEILLQQDYYRNAQFIPGKWCTCKRSCTLLCCSPSLLPLGLLLGEGLQWLCCACVL